MSDNLINKNTVLPKNINDILSSEYQRILLYRVQRLYSLLNEDLSVIKDVVDLFYRNQLKLEDLVKYLGDNLKTKPININLLAQDIVGLWLYIAVDYFKANGQDVEKYLNVSAEALEKYKKNAELMKQAIADEAAGTFNYSSYFYQDEPETNPKIILPTVGELDDDEIDEDSLNDEDRVLRLKKFFEAGLGYSLELVDDNDDLLGTINDELIFCLINYPALNKELDGILSASKILIGKENILVDEKPTEPICANWLKDFFHVVGSDNFDTLSIAKYIITSANAKKLDTTLQTKLRKFLILYHNIKYFPGPFSAIPVESWEILPGSIHGSSSAPVAPNKLNSENKFKVPGSYNGIKQDLAVPKPPVKKEKTVSAPIPVAPTPTPGQTIKATPTLTEIGDEVDLAELKTMLLQYPEGSLERAAIEEEIKTLQKKNSG